MIVAKAALATHDAVDATLQHVLTGVFVAETAFGFVLLP